MYCNIRIFSNEAAKLKRGPTFLKLPAGHTRLKTVLKQLQYNYYCSYICSCFDPT